MAVGAKHPVFLVKQPFKNESHKLSESYVVGAWVQALSAQAPADHQQVFPFYNATVLQRISDVKSVHATFLTH